jgi:hypothetical protein
VASCVTAGSSSDYFGFIQCRLTIRVVDSVPSNYFLWASVTSQDVRLEIERTPKCALHSCIENLENFHAFK